MLPKRPGCSGPPCPSISQTQTCRQNNSWSQRGRNPSPYSPPRYTSPALQLHLCCTQTPRSARSNFHPAASCCCRGRSRTGQSTAGGWPELAVVHVLILFSLVLTFAVWDSAVVPALPANVVGVLGARHIAPRPTVLLVWVPAEVVRPSPLAHLAVPPVAQVGFRPLLAGGSGLRD